MKLKTKFGGKKKRRLSKQDIYLIKEPCPTKVILSQSNSLLPEEKDLYETLRTMQKGVEEKRFV